MKTKLCNYIESMTDVANSDRRKRNKGLMAITVITEITAIKSGKLGNCSSNKEKKRVTIILGVSSLLSKQMFMKQQFNLQALESKSGISNNS